MRIHIRRPKSDRSLISRLSCLRPLLHQAVIAIENVRLFKELEERTHELTRSVGELKALGEVGQAVSSTLDLPTVLSTIVAHAVQLSGTDCGVIYEYDEAAAGVSSEGKSSDGRGIGRGAFAQPRSRLGEGYTGQAALARAPVQVSDHPRRARSHGLREFARSPIDSAIVLSCRSYPARRVDSWGVDGLAKACRNLHS